MLQLMQLCTGATEAHFGVQSLNWLHIFNWKVQRSRSSSSYVFNWRLQKSKSWLIKILCSDEVEICQAKWVSVKTNRKSVLHELEICGLDLIPLSKSEPLWLPYRAFYNRPSQTVSYKCHHACSSLCFDCIWHGIICIPQSKRSS